MVNNRVLGWFILILVEPPWPMVKLVLPFIKLIKVAYSSLEIWFSGLLIASK